MFKLFTKKTESKPEAKTMSDRDLHSSDEFLNTVYDTQRQTESRTLRIYMAGDYEQAKQICRQFTFVKGNVCACVSRRDFIYKGGEESGFMVELINYARKPHQYYVQRQLGIDLGMTLCDELCQLSFTLDFDGTSHYVSRFKD